MKIFSFRNWILIAIIVLIVGASISILMRRFSAEFNAKNSSHQLYRIVALSVLGHSKIFNPYGISSGGYGYMRCNYWLGESCSGIVANRSLLESPSDLALVVKAFEEPCKYLNVQATKSDNKAHGDDDQSITEMNKSISVARGLASCEAKVLKDGKSTRSMRKIERVFIYFYEGSLAEHQAEMNRIVMEIKPKAETIGE